MADIPLVIVLSPVRSLSPLGWVERSGTQHMTSGKQKIFTL
ncbi:hypothetical protein [Nostoc sp. DSM 114159]